MIKFLHLADLHLGYSPLYLQEKAADRERDFFQAFKRAVDYALDKPNAISFVLIAGDVFDSPNPADTLVAEVKNQISKLTTAHVPVLIVPGTHDAIDRPGSVYHRGDNFGGAAIVTNSTPELIQTLMVDNRPVNIYSVANVRSETSLTQENFAKKDSEGVHIAFLHAEVLETGLDANSGEIRLTKALIEQSGFDYIALGHYHNQTQYQLGTTLAVYPGTLEGKDFSESGDRYLNVVSIDDGRTEVEKVKINQRELQKIEIDLDRENIATPDQLVQHLKNLANPDLLARVLFTGVADFVPGPDLIKSQVSGSFYYLDIEDDTAIVQSGFIQSIKEEKTIRGVFAKKMLERIETAPPDKKRTLEKALKLTLRHFIQQ
jgi:DNA repair exonuclease SbcCD nuclease subunit